VKTLLKNKHQLWFKSTPGVAIGVWLTPSTSFKHVKLGYHQHWLEFEAGVDVGVGVNTNHRLNLG
jgi:hypothetical protein